MNRCGAKTIPAFVFTSARQAVFAPQLLNERFGRVRGLDFLDQRAHGSRADDGINGLLDKWMDGFMNEHAATNSFLSNNPLIQISINPVLAYANALGVMTGGPTRRS